MGTDTTELTALGICRRAFCIDASLRVCTIHFDEKSTILTPRQRATQGCLLYCMSYSMSCVACCEDVASMLRVCCEYVASMLRVCCEYVASMLRVCCGMLQYRLIPR